MNGPMLGPRVWRRPLSGRARVEALPVAEIHDAANELSVKDTSVAGREQHSVVAEKELHSSTEGGLEVNVHGNLAIASHPGDHAVIPYVSRLKVDVFSRPL